MFHQRTDWTADRLAAVPGAWRNRVAGIYAGKLKAAYALPAGRGLVTDAEHAANRWLAETADRMREFRIPLNLSDAEICHLAKTCAAAAVDLAANPGQMIPNAAELRRRMAAFVRSYGIEPPPQKIDPETGELTGITDQGAIKRMGDDLWWRRRLRTVQGRAIETEAIRLGYVHKRSEIYASNATVSRRKAQKERNAKALENTVATNQHGDEFTLAELAAKAVSNPTIRRGELMTRISGFESVAAGLGHIAAFFTQTCPSRMHPKKTAANGAVLDNPKYDGTTPREASKYLSGAWAKTRAAFARAGLAVYGFRIAEPHHDATPHWHLLLFMAAEVFDRVAAIFCRYAQAENAEEMNCPSACEARYLVKRIEAGKGTAAGYIAKYVSKNIDGGGYQVQGDIEGGAHDAYTPSHRVEAWAAQWGIRQFQQIGGPPVGIWRELRRLKDSDDLTDTVRAARAATNKTEEQPADWGEYVRVMGGPTVKRADLPIVVCYTRPGERYNADKDECYPAPMTRYGEEAGKAVFGISDVQRGKDFVTRVYRWEVSRNTPHARSTLAAPDSRRRAEAVDGFDFGRLAGPWTRVNNCTGELANEVQHMQIPAPFWLDDADMPATNHRLPPENWRADGRAG